MGRGKRLAPVPLRPEHHADFPAGVRSREGARASLGEMQEKTVSLPLEHRVHRAFLSLPAREGQTTKGCCFSPKRAVRGCHTLGWNREAHAASAGGFLLFWTSLWSAVPGGVAGAVSDPCLPQDPHPHAGAVGLRPVLRWPRWAGGVVLGTAGSLHGCTKSGCTCSSHGARCRQRGCYTNCHINPAGEAQAGWGKMERVGCRSAGAVLRQLSTGAVPPLLLQHSSSETCRVLDPRAQSGL